MRFRCSTSVKPLAAALTIALSAASMGASAGTPSNSAFATQMQAFKNAVAQIKQDYAQHPAQFMLFPKAQPHTVVFRQSHGRVAPAAPTATIAVTNCVDNAASATTSGSLRYAVINAAAGNTIDLSACNNSTITLTQGALPVTVDNLTITAGSGNHVTIDGNGQDRVFYDTAPGSTTTNVLALKYLTIENGRAPLTSSTPKVAEGGCIVSAKDGVGLYYSTVTGCRADSPAGSAAGGGIFSYGGLFMIDSSITNNVASATKAGTSTSKYAAIGGGAFSVGPTYLVDSHIDGNSLTLSGGADFATGGGLFALAPRILVSTVSNNTVRISAGSSTSHGYFAAAGGVAAKYSSTLHDVGEVVGSTISGNSVACTSKAAGPYMFCLGGGIITGVISPGKNGSLNIKYSTISDNHADFIGGGVLSKYSLALSESTISGNSALGGAGLVQKYIFKGQAGIYNSTIASNVATYAGGGIFDYTGGFYGPTTAPAPITMVSSIVAKNTAAGAPGDIYLANTYSTTISGTSDLVMAATSNVTLPAGTLSADPLLAPLNTNGGPTLTMGLLPGSPALGTGSNPKNYTTDQRGKGFPRTTGTSVDIGAFQGTVVPIIPAPTLSAWALGLLIGLFGWVGWRRTRAVARRD